MHPSIHTAPQFPPDMAPKCRDCPAPSSVWIVSPDGLAINPKCCPCGERTMATLAEVVLGWRLAPIKFTTREGLPT